MGVTAREFVDKALSYEGYREKNHANANLEDFYNDAGDGNHTIFQELAVGWTGDQWCQYFVDGIAVMLTGSREAAKHLLCQDGLSRMTGYTPIGLLQGCGAVVSRTGDRRHYLFLVAV